MDAYFLSLPSRFSSCRRIGSGNWCFLSLLSRRVGRSINPRLEFSRNVHTLGLLHTMPCLVVQTKRLPVDNCMEFSLCYCFGTEQVTKEKDVSETKLFIHSLDSIRWNEHHITYLPISLPISVPQQFPLLPLCACRPPSYFPYPPRRPNILASQFWEDWLRNTCGPITIATT